MTIRVFGAPHRYLQGPGALDELPKLVALYGARAFVVADAAVADLLGRRVADLFAPGALTLAPFGGECTAAEIDRLSALGRETGAEVVIALGGGKAIDTAKGVRLALGLKLIVCPTVASNDSPTSRLVVVYTPDHAISEVRLMSTNPDVVLVDTAIIARAPARFFAAGIGDALSKRFEVEQAHAAGGLNFYGGAATDFAVTIAESCYGVLRRDGLAALDAVRRHEAGDAVERVVEATILLSGLGFESGGLSIAHSLTRGFSVRPELGRWLHGEQVAVGLLVQLAAEGRDDAFMRDLIGFYRQIGLPASLGEMGVSDPAAITEIVATSWATAPYIRNFIAPLSPEILGQACRRLEGLSGRTPA